MYSKKLSGIDTLSWERRINGIASWMTLKSSEIKEFLVLTSQYNIEIFSCCLRLLALMLFHISSDQCWEFSKSFRRLSLNLQNSIAPSSSRGFWPWRRRVVSLFATGECEIGLSSWFNISPYSFTNRYSSCGWASRGRSSWFCFSLWSACKKQVHSFSTRILPSSSQRSPARCRRTLCRSSLWPSYSIHEKFWPTSEKCLCLQIQF